MVFLFGMELSTAQQHQIDSLHQLMRGRIHDTVRVNSMNRLTFLRRTRPRFAISSGKEALSIARRIGFKRGEAEALQWLSMAYYNQFKYDSARLMAEQALSLSESSKCREGVLWAHIGLCWATMETGDMDGAALHAEQLRGGQVGLDNSELLVWIHLTQGQLRQRKNERDEALRSFSEALRIAESLEDSLSLADTHFYLVRYYGNENLNAGRKHAIMLLEIATAREDSLKVGIAHLNLAGLSYEEHNRDSARVHYQYSLELGERLDNTRLIEAATFNLGVIEAREGRLDAGLRAFIRGANLARKQKNSRLLRHALMNIAQLLSMQKQHGRAIDYLKESLSLCSQQKDTSAIAQVLDDIGMAFYWGGRYDSAVCYLQRAVTLAESVGGKKLGWRLSNYGYVQSKIGQHDSSAVTFQRALVLGRELEDIGLMHNALAGLARVQAHFERWEEARASADEAYALASMMNDPYAIRNAATSLLTVCEKQGDFKGAYEALLKHTAMNDSLLQEENQRTINELSTKYEADQREKQIALLEKDKELKDLTLAQQKEQLRVRTLEALKRKQQIGLLEKDKEIQSLELLRHQADYARQAAVTEQRENEVRLLTKDKLLQASLLERETFRRNAILGGLLALLIVTGLIFYRLRERKKANTRLSNTLSELRRTQDQLIHSEKMATLGELTAGIAHEIKNPLNFVTNFSTLSGEMVEELETQLRSGTVSRDGAAGSTRDSSRDTSSSDVDALLQDLKANMTKIQEHGSRADGIVASMLLHARSQKGVRQESDLNVLLKEAVQLAWHGMRA
ncbi:MAG: hypothetical protein C0600_11590, partial [Ignavibacteria bacterium]